MDRIINTPKPFKVGAAAIPVRVFLLKDTGEILPWDQEQKFFTTIYRVKPKQTKRILSYARNL